MKDLVSKSWNAALIGSGAANIVAGESWYKSYIHNLDEDKQTQIASQKDTNMYWSGDGQLVPAISNVDIPIVLADQHILLNTDIVSSDIPLLLFRKGDHIFQKWPNFCFW